jgi:hypothetical protein
MLTERQAGAVTSVPPPLVQIRVKHHVAFVRFANESITMIVLRRGAPSGRLLRSINLKPSPKSIRTVKLGRLARGSYTLTLSGTEARETVYFGVGQPATAGVDRRR